MKVDGKFLGKIETVKFGRCGYQEAGIGLSLTFSGEGWGVGQDEWFWDPQIITPGKNHEWNENDRDLKFSHIVRFVSRVLVEAGVDEIAKLKGRPVEVTIENSAIVKWRILTEVL